jgi:hypothetical protein
VGVITQALTSDGGSALAGDNCSAPTRDRWHNRLGIAWRRKYASPQVNQGLGNWLDTAQLAEGRSAFARFEAATEIDQHIRANVTALLQRWQANGQNRGMHLLASTNASLWPVQFYGRADGNPANRPQLTVVTSSGTYQWVAKANAAWHRSSFSAPGSALAFGLAAGESAAVLRFDLSGMAGAVQSATLSLRVKAFPNGGGRGQIIEVYESDPPSIGVPEQVAAPQLGLAAAYNSFGALRSSGHPDLIFASDFSPSGPFQGGFTPAAARVLNPQTGTTYAQGTIAKGAFESADLRRDVSAGSGPRGTPDVVESELFGQYWLYLEENFGTTAETAIKIPSMGVQFGWWNRVGYWQSTTGNGGLPGTGLKVDNGGSTPFEYQGHSVRFLTGVAPQASDDDPYAGWFGIGIYPYNLDQVGPFPAGESFPNVAIRKGQWYCIDMRVKQNSLSGAQDRLGNYATANPDGVYQVWINGMPVYSRTDYRWRRHAEFGVQGVWLDVYHGGTVSAPQAMNYRLDRVALARRYIGPPGR